MNSDDPRRRGHEPVLVREVVQALQPFPGGVFVDATLGLGNHAEAVLRQVHGIESFVGIDRDGEALEQARRRLSGLPVPMDFLHGNFGDLGALLGEGRRGRVGGILLDLGVSSLQLDQAERGFSHRLEGPLDMRMDRSRGKRAYDVVNGYSEEELGRVIRLYGEERGARAIARAIVRARSDAPIADTGRLAGVISLRLDPRWRTKGLSRVFQAIRIEVNEELRSLDAGLDQAVDFLAPEGRLAVLAYHSLEDRRVKEKMRECARGCVCPPHLPVCRCRRAPALRLSPRRAIRPSESEVNANPRARSARLRVAIRIVPREEGEGGNE